MHANDNRTCRRKESIEKESIHERERNLISYGFLLGMNVSFCESVGYYRSFTKIAIAC